LLAAAVNLSPTAAHPHPTSSWFDDSVHHCRQV